MSSRVLRYGENPHQQAVFHGDLDAVFTQLGGKELSYNNLVDIDAALHLIDEFRDEPVFAVIKHTNPCGIAVAGDLETAWKKALECDPLSAFGGILAGNGRITAAIASSMEELFFEVLIAPAYDADALEILRKKKNRILLERKPCTLPARTVRTILNGTLEQDKDLRPIVSAGYEIKTSRKPTETELKDIVFGEKIVKHLKSNAIAIVKNGQLIGSGTGQTSRVDALKQALSKAKERGFDVKGAVLTSDAFFPFADSAEIAHSGGIEVLAEPGGSVRDSDTVNYCQANGLCLVITHIRHFKH